MGIQSSMGTHKLDVRYGNRTDLVYYNGILDGSLTSDASIKASITAGRVYSLSTAGKLVPGILAAKAAGGGEQPYFGWSGLDDNNYPDTERDRGMPGFYDKPSGGVGAGFYGIPVTSNLVGGFATIAWKSAVELWTTEYDSTAGATYAEGDPLTVVSAAATGAGGVTGDEGKTVRGLVRPVEAATDVVVGYVAPAGVFTGPEGYTGLAFYPTFIPGTTIPDTQVADD